MSKRGRPRTDHLVSLERAAALLAEQPDITASQLAADLRIRKQAAQRIVRVLRAASNGSDQRDGFLNTEEAA